MNPSIPKTAFLLALSCAYISVQGISAGKPAIPKTTETAKVPGSFEALMAGMAFRSIGPAVTSGRVIDLAVNPVDKSEWYVAAACGGLWKTQNAGTSFYPVFDGQASYSIACVRIDPKNPHTVWVGSGENNNQRSVGYGDGVYKSEDGGKTWKNMGLKTSEHIGMISIDPENSSIVYVAAYGPLWSSGGERGIYKTSDGGNSWNRILFVSDNTGFNEIHIDPSNSNILYATAHQRRRHEWTYIGGGPESALYRSNDKGISWSKVENGMPKGDVGRIALAISPVNTDIVYALVEGGSDNQGMYVSTDRGASFEKRSSYASSGNYYMEIFADPGDVNTVYSMNTWAEVSRDGGRSFKGLGEKNKHVDNHVLWIDRDNSRHYLMGCDGGLYESWDGAATWDFKSNLPITQFYRVTVDNAEPFYNVYGGTQDNNTLGGPSRTISASGIHNTDWFVTVGGDGFKTVVDPKDPNTVYSQSQYGGLVRFNRKTGEVMDIRPQEKPGEAAYRFNWDAPIVLSQQNNSTLYYAAQKVFRSTDRGNSWAVISPDLSRGMDRNTLPVMGKVWSMDAVAKNQSTSIYGNITALSESPWNPLLLYAGTDDGLIQVTSDGGKTWTRTERISGVPDRALVQNIYASRHDEQIAYAVINNHRNGDFKPYLVKSSDRGKTWTLVQTDLPGRGSLQCLAEDHKNRDLVFAGTDFALYASRDGGAHWYKFSGGLPTICIKEIVVQERENDLVLASFGRGFYILDDYSPLQNYETQKSAMETGEACIFPVKDGLVFIESSPLGHKGKSFQGESFYTAENPPVGAVITYYIGNDYKSIKETRKEKEEKQANDFYPSLDSIKLEAKQPETYILAVIKDSENTIVRQYRQAAKKGICRLVWNGRYDKTSPVSFYTPDPGNPYESEDQGPMALPGVYTVELKLVQGNSIRSIGNAASFSLKTISGAPGTDMQFNRELAEFRRVVLGVNQYCEEILNRINFIRKGSNQMTNDSLVKQIGLLEEGIYRVISSLRGDAILASREFETLPGIAGSLEGIVGGLWSSSQAPTNTYREKLAEIKDKFSVVYADLIKVINALEALEKQLDLMHFPYTPGRLPDWKR